MLKDYLVGVDVVSAPRSRAAPQAARSKRNDLLPLSSWSASSADAAITLPRASVHQACGPASLMVLNLGSGAGNEQGADRQTQIDAHNQATEQFIVLANEMVNEKGYDPKLVSAALMAGSGVYATFVTAGNEGFLAPNGANIIAETYKNNLAYIQKRKKEELEAKGLDVKPVAEQS